MSDAPWPEGDVPTPPMQETATPPLPPELAPSAAPRPASGRPSRIGRFEIRELLGAGGFGFVYRAYDTALKRAVALKLARPELVADERSAERFQREARAAGVLTHPNIVPVFDSGREGPHHYIASAFIPGETLEDAIERRKTIPHAEAADIARKLAEALAYAHRQGVVHRDVKPANVMLREDGEPLLTDFGLAARADEQGRLTQANEFPGTPAYMAPEQWRGQAGAASDQYSLGCLLFEMLTGERPYVGGNFTHYLALHVQAPVPPLPGVPRDLEAIVQKCLEKEPEGRYGNCQELADDLRRWLRGDSTKARPLGGLERAWRWARRKPALAGLLAAVVVLLVVGASLVTWQWRVAVGALGRARDEQRRRVLSQLEALRDVGPDAVPTVLAGLRENVEDALPDLRSAFERERSKPRRARLALGLLDDSPAEVREELAARMLEAEDPGEVLLLRDALAPHAAGMAEGLWGQNGLRSRVALARFDPESPRWKAEADGVVRALLAENPLHLGAWMRGLRPVRAALVPALMAAFRDGEAGARGRMAALVLADYLADDADALAGLLLDAGPEQYQLLRFALTRHREKVLARMSAEAGTLPDYWGDAPVPWPAAGAALVREIEAAGGLVEGRSALCQALPLGRLEGVTEGLRACGYRPTRVRPHERGVAVVWTRDGRRWKLRLGLTAEEAEKATEKGLVVADVAGYRTKGGDRYALLWAGPEKGERAFVYAGVPSEEHKARTDVPKAGGFVPGTVQGLLGADGRVRYCGVWRRWPGQARDWDLTWDNQLSSFEDEAFAAQRLLVDVGAHDGEAGAGPQFAAAWAGRDDREAKALAGLAPAAHLKRARELASRGWRPVGISVAGGLVASAWHRPVLSARRVSEEGRRRAAAAATLLNLGRQDRAWPLLGHRADPTVASHLVALAGPLGVDVKLLLRRLDAEQDEGALRNLILALGEYTEKELPAGERGPVARKLLGWYREGKGAGVRGAVRWLLGHGREGARARRLDWGQGQELARIDRELAAGWREGAALPRRGWYVNGQAQTFVVFAGPSEFRMGSPHWDTERNLESDEPPHRRVIGHGFALAAAPVTVREWGAFRKENPDVPAHAEQYAPEPDCPIINVSMYDAMRYCNWLSKKERIAEGQWCYPGKIGKGMTLPADFLKRRGYRLPLEAEWEYAARGGTTARRACGEGELLLRRHAWYAGNAGDRTWPVLMKRPNPWGLADTHGNVFNWCHGPGGPPGAGARQATELGRLSVGGREDCAIRGGSFLDAALYVRPAYYNQDRPESRDVTLSLRPCRTYE